MTDNELLATCIADEAGNQPYEGKVAVAIVLMNRMTLKYESDGTVIGTVLKHFQFSGFWFDMVDGKYTQTSFTPEGVQAQADKLFAKFSAQPILWANCERAVNDAATWIANQNGQVSTGLSFTPGPAFAGLTPKTVLYYNPAICEAPNWATPDKQDAIIYDHVFFHN